MVHTTDIYALKAKLNNLKHQLDQERYNIQEKSLANKYLNKVIDYVDELRLY